MAIQTGAGVSDSSDTLLQGEIPCNICGTREQKILYSAGVAQPAQIVQCPECGLMYSSPRWRPADHELYKDSNIDDLLNNVTNDPNHPYYWRYEKEKGQTRDVEHARQILNQLYPNRGRMVEVGSGMGYLIRSFKKDGWDVLGIDPWKAAPAFTRSEHGIETLPTTLEEAKLPDASVDALVLLHVIEHVPDPVATLKEIHRVLKPGGHLVMETPRYDTLMYKLLRHRERSLRCEGHIYFFTLDSLRQAYEKAGFSEVDTRAVGRTLSLERFVWNLGVVIGNQTIRKSLEFLSKKLFFNKVRATVNLQDMQRVIVRKSSA